VLAPGLQKFFARQVGVAAAIAHVFHMPAPAHVELMEHRICTAIEFKRMNAGFFAQRAVEGRRGLEPLAVDPQLGVAMKDEQIRAHHVVEPLAREMVAHVGIAQSRGHAQHTCSGCEQGGLGDAKAAPGCYHMAGFESLLGNGEVIRVVDELVTHRVIELDGDLTRRLGRVGHTTRKGNNRWVVAVSKAPRRQIGRHVLGILQWHGFSP